MGICGSGNLRICISNFYTPAIYSYNDHYIWKPASISLVTLYPSRPYMTISNFSNVNVSWHYFPFSYTWLLNYIILNHRFDMVWFNYSGKTISFWFSTWKNGSIHGCSVSHLFKNICCKAIRGVNKPCSCSHVVASYWYLAKGQHCSIKMNGYFILNHQQVSRLLKQRWYLKPSISSQILDR